MTQEMPEMVGKPIGLFDSETGESLQVQRAFNVTEHFRNASSGQKVILTYTRASHGEVGIIECGEEYLKSGYGLNFQVENILSENPPTFQAIGRYARNTGIHPELLVEIILTHATRED